ncbi:beta-galactosidase [Flammeovirga pacifica]|nr:beta-galactosidase [Flammeovirga pacifica]
MKKLLIIFVMSLCTMMTQNVDAQDWKKEYQFQKKELMKKISKADKKGIDTYKEKSTLRTAEICVLFADWDSKNVKENEKLFKKLKTYKDSANAVAKALPVREKEEVLTMLQQATNSLELALKGEISKQKSVDVDWTDLSLDGSDILYKDQPVFLADYSWKPKSDMTWEYHGKLDGFFMTTAYLTSKNGDFKPKFKEELFNKKESTAGFVFLNHLNPPKFFTDEVPDASIGKRRYFDYDIDHPATKELLSLLLKNTVPHTKDKKYSQLGYMLVNEPHWHTKKGEWDAGDVSKYTIEKFKNYLKEKHQSIAQLNEIWKTDYQNFDQVDLQIPIDPEWEGKPQWYDWCRFNQLRGNDWFDFLDEEIKKYDTNAKTHVKVMPHLFTNNGRTHGIDLEYITQTSDIIGNDAGSTYSDMWRMKDPSWQKHYAFDWRQLCMSYDFMKSVSPDKIMFNTECHFISTIRFRDLYMQPDYARATYWLATTLGMNAVQTWFWPRDKDGSLRKKSKGYAASLTQMPLVLNEITLTYADLNANGSSISELQKLRKPIRIFQSETSAIINEKYMDEVYAAYENVLFEGWAIGFATEGILTHQNQKDWDVLVIKNTPYVTASERDALQKYLDNGGQIIMDKSSIRWNEYKQPITPLSSKNITYLEKDEAVRNKALELVKEQHPFELKETLGEKNTCLWRYHKVENGKVLMSIVNIGNKEKGVHFNDQNVSQVTNVIDGTSSLLSFKIAPLEVKYIEIECVNK